MKILYLYAMLAAALVIQATIVPVFAVFQVKPDLVLILAVAACFYFDYVPAVVFAVVAGAAKDLFAVQPFGMYTLLLPLMAFAVLKAKKEIELDAPVVRLLFLLVFVCVFEAVFTGVSFLQHANISGATFAKVIVIESLYTAVLFCLAQRTLDTLLQS